MSGQEVSLGARVVAVVAHVRLSARALGPTNCATTANASSDLQVLLLLLQLVLDRRIFGLSKDHLVSRENKYSAIQNGYRKYGTHPQVFAQILEHGNSKNEIKQRHEGSR